MAVQTSLFPDLKSHTTINSHTLDLTQVDILRQPIRSLYLFNIISNVKYALYNIDVW